jgi:hypothetical protein
MQDRLTRKSPFLWVDEDPMRRQQLNSGEIVISPVGKTHPLSVPHGLIHHWVGAVFIPGATIPDLSAVVRNYGRYSEMYRPTLIKAELLDSSNEEQKFSVLWVQKVLLVTAAFYTELNSGRAGNLGARTHPTSGKETSKETGTYRARDKRKALEAA